MVHALSIPDRFFHPLFLSIPRYYMLLTVIGRTNQRSAFDIIKAKLIANISEFFKFIGVHEAYNRQMFFCWLKILANRDHIDSAVAKICDGLDYFLFLLPQAKHYAA